MIEILPVGGMDEIGRNMTAIGFDGEYVIVDMGVRLDSILALEDVDIGRMSRRELININAIPDDAILHGKNVKGIFFTHGHLDHIGAVGKLAYEYRAPLYGTPYTMQVLKEVLREESCQVPPKKDFHRVDPGATVETGDITVEFIPVTHSIPHTSLLLVRRREETVLVASDFKLDENPLLGHRTDVRRLRGLSGDGLKAALVGCVRLNEVGPTPSEARAREMLREVMGEACDGSGMVFITTFSSHIARLKSIVELSLELGRRPVMVGRSLKNYCSAAIDLGLVKFPEELKIYGRPNSARTILKKLEKERRETVIICTGHQGEPTSVLSRIADGKLSPAIQPGDSVVFSASVIPNPINQANRQMLEVKLEAQGAIIYRDVHVSGHAGKTDTKEFLRMVNPENIIPCHGTPERLEAMVEISRDLGYSEQNIHRLKNWELWRG
ncbi:MAG: MBL fold metallo-hydrolase [Candidatus Hadarchaeales archaeon]